MRYLFLNPLSIFFTLIMLGSGIVPPDESEIEPVMLTRDGEVRWIYYVHGESSDKILNELLDEHDKKVGKHEHYNFKNITIEGIDYPVKFSVNVGLHTISGLNETTFYTFTSPGRKTEVLASKKPADRLGMMIYIQEMSLRYKPAIKTEQENEAMVRYLQSLVDS